MRPGTQRADQQASTDARRAQAAMTILAWVARSDGPVGHARAAALADIALKSGTTFVKLLPDTLRDCESIDFEELRQSFEQLLAMPEQTRQAMIGASVALGFAGGAPGPACEHAIRLVADAAAGSGDAELLLARAYERHGSRLRPPGDPTSFDWWAGKGERRLGAQTEAGIITARGLSELRDLAMLGLMPSATKREIREAYKEIARRYHPDHFHDRPEAVRQQALEHFRRVRTAYERLMSP